MGKTPATKDDIFQKTKLKKYDETNQLGTEPYVDVDWYKNIKVLLYILYSIKAINIQNHKTKIKQSALQWLIEF